jgi:hypothetical protein
MSYYKNLPRYLFLTRILRIEEDWLTPVEYLPYIYALLGDIDLDPCTTEHANKEYLRAKKIYTLKEDGLNTHEPWLGKTYLFPPTYGRCSFSKERGTWRWGLKGGHRGKSPSVVWFNRLEKEWKLRNVSEALLFSTSHEILRSCPTLWDYPVCIPKDRARLIHGRLMCTLGAPFTWGFFVYLPGTDLGFNQVDRFKEIFSHIGKVIC